MNEKSFSHHCRFGTKFSCERCDFNSPIKVEDAPTDVTQRMSDVAEMIGFHATNIWPDLNGFQGYDCLQFV